jgi:MoaA/NifB/PqqE/SkfB family radical SAM enzyme
VSERFEKVEVVINPGFRLISGTDEFDDCDKSFGPRYAEYRRKWHENPKKGVVSEFPLHLDVESTNNCNLKCPMCSRNFMTEKIGYMSWELYKKIIDEGARYELPSIKLNYRGEPLLHPQLVQMVKYAKDCGILEVQFNTNGFLLDEKKASELLDAGLDRIIFSVDGATRETYNKIRVGSDFDTVVNNIKRLIKMRNDRNMKRPCVRVQMINMEETRNELDSFVEMWKPIANKIGITTKREPDPTKGVVKYTKAFPCPQIWQRMMICWDGEVRMCCGDWMGEVVIGDARKDDLYELWHGETYSRMREFHRKGEFNKIPVCARCEVNKI